MKTTLGEIHRDPEILNRTISPRERLDILTRGGVTATSATTVAD